jgi:hypothetical protein
MAQQLLTENVQAGSKLSRMTLAGRKILGQMFLREGEYDPKVVETETFFSNLGENVLRRAKEFPGALSNDDRVFLEKLSGDMESGDMEMSTQSIRQLMIIREKMARAEVRNFKERVAADRASSHPGRRGMAEPYGDQPFDVPEPGRFVQEEFAKRGGDKLIAAAKASGKIADPVFVRRFEEQFGVDSLPYFLAKTGG